MTPLPEFFLLDLKAHHKRCNGIKIPHEVISTVRAKQFFVQHHPGWQGLVEPSLIASYIDTSPAANTKSITRKGRLTPLLSPWLVNSTRRLHLLIPVQHPAHGTQLLTREAGLGPSPLRSA